MSEFYWWLFGLLTPALILLALFATWASIAILNLLAQKCKRS